MPIIPTILALVAALTLVSCTSGSTEQALGEAPAGAVTVIGTSEVQGAALGSVASPAYCTVNPERCD